MKPEDILHTPFVDLIFEKRNQEYGAYEHRVNYQRRLFKALLITVFISILFAILLFFSKSSQGKYAFVEVEEIKIAKIQLLIPQEESPRKKNIRPRSKLKISKGSLVEKEEAKSMDEELAVVKLDLEDISKGSDSFKMVLPPLDAVVEDEIQNDRLDVMPKEGRSDSIYEKVEMDASFNGGAKAWQVFLGRSINFQIPYLHGAPPGLYRVVIKFVIEKSGKITDATALTKMGYGMEESVIQAILSSPNWVPALQNSKPISCYRQQPIVFRVGGL